jgi:hypothetical protein
MKTDRGDMTMNKQSFIRGFGVGVLFATVILGASCLIRTSDAAVIKKAKSLGMEYKQQEEALFETSSPASKGGISKGKTKSSAKPSETSQPQKAKATAKPTAKTVGQEQGDSSDLTKEDKQVQQEMEDAVTEFTIKEGEWSDEVSRNLKDLDIISDASAFDDYLEKNGYSDDIKAGTFQISMDATYEEIAKEITR